MILSHRSRKQIWKQIWMMFLVFAFVGGVEAIDTNNAEASIKSPYSGKRKIRLDAPIFGFSPWGNAGVVGARVGIPILHNGFIPSINNSVSINFGVDAYWIDYDKNGYGIGLGVPVMLHWEFYFSPKWSAFVEAGFNLFLGDSVFNGRGFVFDPLRSVLGAIGGKYHFSETFALVLRLGAPHASFGLSFGF